MHREGWRLPLFAGTRPEVPFRRRPAKSDGFQKTRALCAASEPIEIVVLATIRLAWDAPRDCSRVRRPGSAQCHAAPHVSVIVGALLQRVAPSSPSLSAPRPDEPSAVRRVGRMCRRKTNLPRCLRCRAGGHARPQRPKRHLRSYPLASRCAANFMKVLLPSSSRTRNKKDCEESLFLSTGSPRKFSTGCPRNSSNFRRFSLRAGDR